MNTNSCKRCGAPILHGEFCPTCFDELAFGRERDGDDPDRFEPPEDVDEILEDLADAEERADKIRRRERVPPCESCGARIEKSTVTPWTFCPTCGDLAWPTLEAPPELDSINAAPPELDGKNDVPERDDGVERLYEAAEMFTRYAIGTVRAGMDLARIAWRVARFYPTTDTSNDE